MKTKSKKRNWQAEAQAQPQIPKSQIQLRKVHFELKDMLSWPLTKPDLAVLSLKVVWWW